MNRVPCFSLWLNLAAKFISHCIGRDILVWNEFSMLVDPGNTNNAEKKGAKEREERLSLRPRIRLVTSQQKIREIRNRLWHSNWSRLLVLTLVSHLDRRGIQVWIERVLLMHHTQTSGIEFCYIAPKLRKISNYKRRNRIFLVVIFFSYEAL
jgi:hypothetical protein